MPDIPTTAGVYCILNEITGKIYIGSAVNLRERKRQHFRMLENKCHPNKHLQSSFNKYGLDNFSFHVIELVNDKALLVQREQVYIDETQCCTDEKGYNLCPTAGSKLGKKHSDEARAKMSAAKRGKRFSEEHRQNLSVARRGKKFSEEHRQRLSEALRGEKNPNWGKTFSDEHRRKLSEAGLRRYRAERDALQLLLDF